MWLISNVEEYLNMTSLVTATIGLVIAMLFIQGPRNRWAVTREPIPPDHC